MKKVCFIQPLIANYCIPLFTELGRHWQLTVIYSPTSMRLGFGNQANENIYNVYRCEVSEIRPLGDKVGICQIGIIRHLRKIRPDAVIIFANLRYLSFWTTLFWCKARGIPVFLHGHGLYRKVSAGDFWKVIYYALLRLSSAYICYTPSVAASLLRLGLPEEKIVIADNSLENACPVRPDEKSGAERGILYVGRLRPGCRMELLISTVARLRDMGQPMVTLHIIGDGPDAQRIRQIALDIPWVRFYGSVYEPEQIRKISRSCMVGCYPGNSGLSIIHLMSLSLPPITHDNLPAHHGPEPSYIKPGENGLLFDHRNPENGLLSALMYMLEQPTQLKEMQVAAYATYNQLTKPSLAMRFVKIVGE